MRILYTPRPGIVEQAWPEIRQRLVKLYSSALIIWAIVLVGHELPVRQQPDPAVPCPHSPRGCCYHGVALAIYWPEPGWTCTPLCRQREMRCGIRTPGGTGGGLRGRPGN